MGGGRWVGGKIIPRIRLTSAKDLVEVEAELGNFNAFPSSKRLFSNVTLLFCVCVWLYFLHSKVKLCRIVY